MTNADFADQLRAAIKATGLSRAELGRRLGVSRATVTNWPKTGTIAPENLDALNSLSRMNLVHPGDAKRAARRNVDSVTERKPQAQKLSLSAFAIPQVITLEEVAVKYESGLPPTFVLVVPDDAIGTVYQRGVRLVFDRSREPKPGRVVMVRDRSGTCYLRIYGNQTGNQWSALATGFGHRTLDSEADGLTVVATAAWVEAP